MEESKKSIFSFLDIYGPYKYVFLILIAIALVLLVVIIVVKNQEKDEDMRMGKQVSKTKNFFFWLYRIYSSIPGLKKYFYKTQKRVSLIYPSDSASINRKTTNILLKGTLAGIVGAFVAVITANGNPLFLCSGLFVTYILINEVVNNSLISIEDTIYEQLKLAIERINHYYSRNPFIDYAVKAAMEDLSKDGQYEITLHLKNIYDIVTSPFLQDKLDQYAGKEPNKCLLQLAMVFSSIKEYGDKKLDNGTGLFIESMHNLKNQVQDEILEREKNKNAFKGQTWICLVVLLLIKPIETWVNTNLPEVSVYYTGTYGVISMVAMFVICVVCYELVVVLRDGSNKEAIKENSIWMKIAQMPVISPFLNAIVNKQYTKYLALDEDLKKMGDRTGPKAFLIKRYTLAIVALIVTNIVLITGMAQSKISALNDFANAFTDSVVVSAEYRAVMEETALDFTQTFKNQKNMEIDFVKQSIMDRGTIEKESEAELIAKTVIERIDKANNQYYRWYYLLISLTMAYIGYMVPTFFFAMKKKAMEEKMEEELVQFQSLMLILMHMNGMTLGAILSWMERFAYCFKTPIMECRRNLNRGSYIALSEFRIKEKDEYMPLALFIDNLMEIDRSGVEQAFGEVESDKDYILKSREEKRRNARENKSGTASMICMIPIYVILILQLIIPVGLMAYNMYQTFGTYM